MLTRPPTRSSRYRRPAQRRQVHPVQRRHPHPQGGGGQLPLLHDRPQRRRRHRAGRPPGAVLQKISKTSVVIPAAIEFVDIAGLVKGAARAKASATSSSATSARSTPSCRSCAASRTSTSTTSPAHRSRARHRVINTELILADLDIRREAHRSQAKQAKRGDKEAVAEDAVLAKIEPHLDRQAGADVRAHPRGEGDREHASLLLTDKPTIFACNVKDTDLATADNQPVRAEGARLREDPPRLRSGGHQRADRERPHRPRARRKPKEFLKDLGVKESGVGSLIRATYHLLGCAPTSRPAKRKCAPGRSTPATPPPRRRA
jgi:hypothetical protein